MDNIVGVVATRELWRRQLVGEPIDIHAAMETPLFIPEGTSMLSAMEQLRNLRSPMAIVMDEYGGVSGLITLNDVVADLVGDPSDTTTAEQGKVVRREDGSMLVDGDYAAHEVIELLGITELPGEAESRYETLGGFIVNQLGEIPQTCDFVEHGSYRFEVMDMDGNRIDKVLIQNIEPI
jgi:putative hemolysin